MKERRTVRQENGFRNAWAVLFVMDVTMCLLSLPYLLRARSLEPKAMRIAKQASTISPDLGHFMRSLLRLVGLNWLTSGSLAAIIAVTGLRGGELWAWYAHWGVAAYWLGDSTIDKAAGGSGWVRGYLWTALMMAALLAHPQTRVALSHRPVTPPGLSAQTRAEPGAPSEKRYESVGSESKRTKYRGSQQGTRTPRLRNGACTPSS